MPIEETLCPECGKRMVSRINNETKQRFWGCPDYPNCTGTRDTDGNSKYEKNPELEREDVGRHNFRKATFRKRSS